MNCLYLDSAAAGVEERKRYAFTARGREALCRRFLPLGGLVPVVTCGRTELYFTCPRAEAERAFSAFMENNAGGSGGAADFSFCGGKEAVLRLFRLAAGLLSMLKGEDEILGQVRHCYEFSRALGAARGMDAAFQAALSCGKRVRAETKISSLACSIATLAANAAFRFGGGNALIVGATGKMGGAVLKNIASKGGWKIVATSRSHAFAASAEGVTAADYAERYAFLEDADVIVSATASPHTVFAAERVAAALRTQKPRLFIDLSVPPDVEAGVADIPGCTLLGIDGFRAAAEENNAKKRSAIAAAEKIAKGCAEQFFADEAARRCAPALAALPETERKSLYVLRKSDPAAFCARAEALLADGKIRKAYAFVGLRRASGRGRKEER